MKDAALSIQTYSSSVSEMDCIRVFHAPPLIYPIDGVSRGARGTKRINVVKRPRGVWD